MVQAMINIPKEINQILNIVKARYGLQTKSQAISKVVLSYGQNIIEPELKPEYIKKLKNLEEKGEFIEFNSLNDLKENLENA